MRRLKLLLLLFSLALATPLGYLILRTHASLERDETAELRFFAETLFNQMEEELALLVQKEESRAVEDYNHESIPPGLDDFAQSKYGAHDDFIGQSYLLGYLQNNQDGAAQIALPPWADTQQRHEALRGKLEEVNDIFNLKRANIRDFAETDPAPPPAARRLARADEDANVADKYLESARPKKNKAVLGQEKKRVVGITPNQAQNLAQKDLDARKNAPRAAEQKAQLLAQAPDQQEDLSPPSLAPQPFAEGFARQSRVGQLTKEEKQSAPPTQKTDNAKAGAAIAESPPAAPSTQIVAHAPPPGLGIEASSFALEIDPLQSVAIDADTVFIYRRIVLGNAIFRQGFALRLSAFLEHLGRTYFKGQPMARFTNLTIEAHAQGQEETRYATGARLGQRQPRFLLKRQFPRPFSFLQASLVCDEIPRSEGRNTLYIMLLSLAVVMLAGLVAIYKSAAVVVDLSERRSGFVSSVTHELKTPLTTIRLYIEMLQQGVATCKEQEREYLRILNTETGRLSRLIQNVLEFSRLERKQSNVTLREGDFEDVLREVMDIMREKLRQDGFVLNVAREGVDTFAYDREAMIQILINCIDNSIKFGGQSERKEIAISLRQRGDRVEIAISDAGPGIPRHALKNVFDDFYRVDNSLTRKTQGAGIGLSLVKQLAAAMGGGVKASNNTPAPGCAITVDLPLRPRSDAAQDVAS